MSSHRRSLAILLAALAPAAWGATPPAAERVITLEVASSAIPPDISQDFGTVLEGEPVTLKIRVRNEGETALAIGAVRPMCACMSESSDRSVAAGATGTITLRLETADYNGPTTEAALVQWVDAPVSVTRVELKLDVRPALVVEPRRLIRFRAAHGTASSQVVQIRTADGSPFRVLGVDGSAPFLSGTATVTTPGTYQVTVTLGADAPVGMLKEAVTVRTDLPTLPALRLSVTGLVAAPTSVARSSPGTAD